MKPLENCIFCSGKLSKSIQLFLTYWEGLACFCCKPSVYYAPDIANWTVQFKLCHNDIRYLISQTIDNPVIDIFTIAYYKDEEFYIKYTSLETIQILTPENAQNTLDRILNLKAFL